MSTSFLTSDNFVILSAQITQFKTKSAQQRCTMNVIDKTRNVPQTLIKRNRSHLPLNDGRVFLNMTKLSLFYIQVLKFTRRDKRCYSDLCNLILCQNVIKSSKTSHRSVHKFSCLNKPKNWVIEVMKVCMCTEQQKRTCNFL